MIVSLCRRVAGNPWFERTIVGLILVNAAVLGLETSGELVARYGPAMDLANDLILAVFVLEAALKITAVAPRVRRYFGDGWNLFDFTVVVLSLVPATGEYAMIARLARLLRVMRLVSTLPELRLIVTTLVRSLPGLGHVIVLLALIFYMYAVAGYHLLHEHDPVHWRSLWISLLTLFRVLTLEDWTDVMYTAMEMHPAMWVFFVSFVVTATFIVINMFIAVVISNLEDAKKSAGITRPVDVAELKAELVSIRESLATLQERLERDPPR